VAIGPNHIATAGHCLGLLEDAEHRIEVPGQGVYRGVLWLRGGPDAALVVTDRDLTGWAELGSRPEADTTVRYVSARGVDHECLVTTSWSTWVVASCTPWAKPGDSGSPVTGEDGRVWGVLSSGVGPATVFVPLATLRWGK
jgi:V8-like Glu-specific endopeptidase